MENECAICQNEIEEIFSLCDTCGDNCLDWDEKEDTYIMKDGKKYLFSVKTGKYELKGE
ncbi:TPA: hypothetical protein REU56_002942 [Listeria monocytogenes]|nr:hypothetical protein [Listeria monocytogenes]